MYIPDIPGISTSVIDKSVTEKKLNNNRTILLPGFFKYGAEGFQLSESVEEFKNRVGELNISKYGKAYLFGKLAAKTSRVLHYRLLPADATFANNVIDYFGNYSTKQNITRKDQIFITLDDKGKVQENFSMLSALAKYRGEGYNNIFLTFKPATEFEKSYANANGELTYKFNFIQCEIFEETPNGVKSVSDPIVFSLMEKDEVTNQPIVDKTNGKSLFINHVFTGTNDFATLMLNDKYGDDIAKYQNIDSLLQAKKTEENSVYSGLDGRFIVKDINDNRHYEVYVETYYALEENSLGIKVRTKKNRLATRITTRKPRPKFLPIFHYIENDTKYYKEVIVDDNVITYTGEGVKTKLENLHIADVDIAKSYFIDGEDALYEFSVGNQTKQVGKETVTYVDGKFQEYVGAVTTKTTASVDTDGKAIAPADQVEVTTTTIDYNRFALYKKLTTYSMKLYSGTDGKNLYDKSGRLNMYDHPGNIFSQNARELLLDFYNNNQEIREVLYPKHDFDYVPDWSEDGRIQSAIILLADDIGTTMPLVGLPLAYNPKIITRDLVARDLKMRKDGLFWSSYNSMCYSGQINKSHVLDSGEKITMGTAYYALAAHLRIDAQYSITEPVANMIKGVIDASNVNLTFSPTSLEIEQLRNLQINTIIEEPDGTYFIDQLTMYKKASKLSRANVVKTIHRIRKDLPRLLKDLIQLKATSDISGQAVKRTVKYLDKWKVSNNNVADGIFDTVNVKGIYNEETYKLRLNVTVKPIGTIESIDIPIIVI